MANVLTADGRRVSGAFWVIAIALAFVLVGAFVPPLPEPQIFRGLVDKRSFLGIPNFMNVVSSIPFLFVGIWGLYFLTRDPRHRTAFVDARERWPYLVCFGALTLIACGSTYYHLDIDAAGLFWDRLPMAIGFMAFFSAVIVERIGARAGLRLLAPLLAFGAASVLYWRWSVLYATENLLPYAVVQYGTIGAVLVLCAVFSSRYTHGVGTVQVIGIYALAKIAEVLDAQIYALGEMVSGHTLKHLLAAFAGYWLLRMLQLRAPR